MENMKTNSQITMARKLGRNFWRIGLVGMVVVLGFAALGLAANSAPKAAAAKGPQVRQRSQELGSYEMGARSAKFLPFTVQYGGKVSLSVGVSKDSEVNVRVIPASEYQKAVDYLAAPLWHAPYARYESFSRNDVEATNGGRPQTIDGQVLPAGEYYAVLINENYLFSLNAGVTMVETYMR